MIYTTGNNFDQLKDNQAFENKTGICYVPESGDQQYTYQDILDICEGDQTAAQTVFDVLVWQHPETAYLEYLQDKEEQENDPDNFPDLNEI